MNRAATRELFTEYAPTTSDATPALRVVPMTLKEANRMIVALHRHHGEAHAQRWSIGVKAGDRLVGVAVAGRPLAKVYDWRKVLEVLRVCTNGTKNACSCLYSACARIAREMGHETAQTYILASEPGTSLLAAGWERDPDLTRGHRWVHTSPPAPRANEHPLEDKARWFKVLRRQ